MSDELLTLSPFILPELRMGNEVTCAQNLSDGTGRLRYLQGALQFLQGAADAVKSTEQLNSVRKGLPFAEYLIKETMAFGRVNYSEGRDAKDLLHFDPTHLRVLLTDGRLRRADDMLAYETGEMTFAFGQVISALMKGLKPAELLKLAEEVGVGLDADDVEGWLKSGVLEKVPAGASRVPPRLLAGEGDRVTWLGHAMVMFQTPDATLWTDPYPQPKIAWRENEFSQVFSPDYADATLFADYGPQCEQLSVHALPAPDAVLITHQDTDHFNVGALMTLPPHTTFVVPQADPVKRPWEVDLKRVIHQVLGEHRKVVALGHGESVTFGSAQVTAFPFVGEYPSALPHSWNCYLVETPRSVAIFVADAALTHKQAEWLQERLAPKARPAILMARNIYDFEEPGTAHQLGYLDSNDELYSRVRLWPWYVPMQALFDPAPVLGISSYNTKQLVQKAGLKYFFPYALGSTPWFRFTAKDNFFIAKIASMAGQDLAAQAAAAASAGASLPPLKYGVHFRLG